MQMDILKTPYDPDFRLTATLDLKDYHRMIENYSQFLGQINRKACKNRDFESIQTEGLLDCLRGCGVPAENTFSRRNYIMGSDQLKMGYWCVWLSSTCFLYSRDHKLSITYTQDVRVEELEYLCMMIETQFLIRDYRNHLFLHHDTTFFGNGTALVDLDKSDVSLGLHFNEDLRLFTEDLVKKLEKPASAGIVVLSGQTGTGKTHYIRHLIHVVRKRFMVYNPWHLLSFYTEYSEYVADYEQYIFVLEDMDDYIDHKEYYIESFPTYLRSILEGELVDSLKSPHIFTINRPLTHRERKALALYPGLLGHYEFGTLEQEKANHLADHLGKVLPDKSAFTLGEIFHL